MSACSGAMTYEAVRHVLKGENIKIVFQHMNRFILTLTNF